MPSFVARVERPDRGGEWIAYLEARERAASAGSRGSGSTARRPSAARPSVRLLHVDGDEDALLAALLFEAVGRRGGGAHPPGALGADERGALLADLVGARANRRHRPGRGFEALRYRFEIVSDYGAFRDLQRHRMLTVQWQRLTPAPRRRRPEEVDAAGCGDDYRRALDVSRAEWERLPRRAASARRLRALPGLPHPLRARPQRARGDAADRAALRARGPPGYRAVAHEMHRLIGEVHPAVAAAMTHVDATPSRAWSASSARCAPSSGWKRSPRGHRGADAQVRHRRLPVSNARNHAPRMGCDGAMSVSALLFPGQGSHAEGMEEPFREHPLLERGLELLGYDPFDRLAEGTRFQQPALFLCSVAAWATWRESGEGADARPVAAAGHSLGEYAALVAAEALAFDDAVVLVDERAAAMAHAAELQPGGMVALLGGDAIAVRALALRLGLTVANDNAPGQVVLSGPLEAVAAADEAAREETGARARRWTWAGRSTRP
jgi:hypothetical protein